MFDSLDEEMKRGAGNPRYPRKRKGRAEVFQNVQPAAPLGLPGAYSTEP